MRSISFTKKFVLVLVGASAIVALAVPVAQAAEGKLTASGGLTQVIMTSEVAAGSEEVFTVNNGAVKCAAKKQTPKVTSVPATSWTEHAEYSSCKAFGLSGTVTTTGCNFVYTGVSGGALGEASVAIQCETGKAITVKATGSNCVITIGSQTIAQHVTFENVTLEGFGALELTVNITTGIKYTETGTNCAKNGVESSNGKYAGKQKVRGWSVSAGSEGVKGTIDIS